MKDIKNLVAIAAGRQKAGLVLKNANVVNVFTNEIIVADVAISGGYIAGVGTYAGDEEIDCTDRYVCPGFIDAHLHIESTLLMPSELVKLTLPSGTTTMIADPHEITNVAGAKGVKFMLEASEGLPCDIYYMLPSSVPATPFETAGADFTAKDMQPFLNHPRVLGLGEVMCFTDVVNGTGEIFEKLNLMSQRPIDGHAPSLSGAALQAYAAAGIKTEHEATTFLEAAEKARAGFAVLVREGSAAHNLNAIVSGLIDTDMPTNRFMFCTDDKHLEDIRRDGHIRWNVKLAIEQGMSPAKAICMATWNTAQIYGLQNIGAVAAGYKADLVVLKSLKKVEVEAVYKNGINAKKLLEDIPLYSPYKSELLQSVKIGLIKACDFELAVCGKSHVIDMVPYQLTTNHLIEDVPCEKGLFKPNDVYAKLAVIERHGRSKGNVAVAPLKGYGIRGGAIATSVSHDSHNIIVAGDSDADMALAVNRLKEIGGGYVLVKKGALCGEVALPIAGLMSLKPYEEVQKTTAEILAEASNMGIPYYIDPFISLSFLALAVIPSIRLTDKGLFDVDKFCLI